MNDDFKKVFSRKVLNKIFSEDRTDKFFTALLGDPEDGAYDIVLSYVSSSGNRLEFEFQLRQRTGKCLQCNLTHGLPEVFMRHPIINIKEIVGNISTIIKTTAKKWEMGNTIEKSANQHSIPLIITIMEQ